MIYFNVLKGPGRAIVWMFWGEPVAWEKTKKNRLLASGNSPHLHSKPTASVMVLALRGPSLLL